MLNFKSAYYVKAIRKDCKLITYPYFSLRLSKRMENETA